MSFHINTNGDAGKCIARKGRCPFGSPEEHFSSLEEARENYEKIAIETQSGFFGRKRTQAKTIPETYVRIRNRRGVETYGIGRDLVDGDTILTKQGRLYRLFRTTDYSLPFSEQEKFELMELEPKTGAPLDGRRKSERGFKDDFSESVLIIEYNESVKLKKKWLQDENREIKEGWSQLLKEQSENTKEIQGVLRANPKIDEDVPRHERATSEGREKYFAREAAREQYKTLSRKGSEFEMRRFGLSERERFWSIEETNYVLAKRRKPYSISN